jgi:carboxylesterase type B
VIVSVYYRLGALGFLTSPEFIDDSELGDLNAGFQDQIQGLKWVNKYISVFGGDPSKVTINGGSAGGSSTELHLVTDEGNTLFSKAIVQSVYRIPVPMPGQQKVSCQFCQNDILPHRLLYDRIYSTTMCSMLDAGLVRSPIRWNA